MFAITKARKTVPFTQLSRAQINNQVHYIMMTTTGLWLWLEGNRGVRQKKWFAI